MLKSTKPSDGGFKVDFSLLGIRNLTQKMNKPQVTLWLTNNPKVRKVFAVEKDEKDEKLDGD